ncbi:hypothetical protein IEQ34_010536 [Dendrobium chrysotoxum]|uniref:Uncharacterized protein n=1 Tax=Dendrobium chrysotoxum TaxID=161865 RepID=A0AAV7GW51_DENCH|nr:hypothetical protein IEQ34_010536 [Dendrobium chrysotoxum]
MISNHGCSTGNIIYAFWMAFGNILGYASGVSGNWHKSLAVRVGSKGIKGDFWILFYFQSFQELAFWNALCTSCDISHMGIWHGSPSSSMTLTRWAVRSTMVILMARKKKLKLLIKEFNKIVLGISAMLLEPMCHKLSSRIMWVIGNFTLFLALVAITILYSIHFTTATHLVANEGSTQQGLCTGVLNVSIVVPQDSLFGKGNVPAFGLAAALAFVGGFVGMDLLPRLSRNTLMSSSFGSMH